MSKREGQMGRVDQTDVFRGGEGDNWFRRNQDHLAEAVDSDPVMRLVREFVVREGQPASACELGCANGWRLAALRDVLPAGARLAGSDISAEAIAVGRSQYPGLELAVGALDAPNLNGPFDLVIVSFVLHWVARERLAQSIACIDGLVRENGLLVVADFLPDQPTARRYHHRPDIDLFTFKQDYAACFLGLGFYEELGRDIFAHSRKTGQHIDPQDRAACTLLRKRLSLYEPAPPVSAP